MLPLNVFTAADPPLAGADVGDAVHGDHAVETDADAAEQSPWGLVDAGGPPVEDVVRQQNSGDRLAEYTPVCAALEFDLDRCGRIGSCVGGTARALMLRPGGGAPAWSDSARTASGPTVRRTG